MILVPVPITEEDYNFFQGLVTAFKGGLVKPSRFNYRIASQPSGVRSFWRKGRDARWRGWRRTGDGARIYSGGSTSEPQNDNQT